MEDCCDNINNSFDKVSSCYSESVRLLKQHCRPLDIKADASVKILQAPVLCTLGPSSLDNITHFCVALPICTVESDNVCSANSGSDVDRIFPRHWQWTMRRIVLVFRLTHLQAVTVLNWPALWGFCPARQIIAYRIFICWLFEVGSGNFALGHSTVSFVCPLGGTFDLTVRYQCLLLRRTAWKGHPSSWFKQTYACSIRKLKDLPHYFVLRSPFVITCSPKRNISLRILIGLERTRLLQF